MNLTYRKYLLTLLLSTLFFAFTWASAPEEFTTVDLCIIACLLVGVLGVEILIAHMFSWSSIAQNLLLAGFTVTNILYLNLSLNEPFLYLPIYAQLLALLLALFIMTTFMNMLNENTRIARVLPALIALATTGVLVQVLFSTASVPEVLVEHGRTSAKNIRIVDFKIKPNVYFIGLDALIPKVLLQKYLGVETTKYHAVLDTHFRRFKNFFADRVSTRNSLNSLLALDIGLFSEAAKNDTQHYFFPGLVPSPLFEIFKHNGYITNTFYMSQYLGRKQGPYVDNYNYQQNVWDLRWGVCEFINTGGLRAFTFMGYCSLVKSDIFQSILQGLGFGPAAEPVKQIDLLIDHMRMSLLENVPQIFVAYVFSPGHTDNTFDMKDNVALDEYRQAYLNGSEKTAALLNKLVTFIEREDPEAILYVFGDHGPYLSNRVTFDKDSAFFVQDRFGVYGGIYPPDRCSESFATPYNSDFMTILQGAHMIIRCLSGGENAFLVQEDYYLPDFGATNGINRYENYLYE